MIERDYILILVRQLAQMIAKLLRLRNEGDRDGMDEAIYDILKTAGIDGKNPLLSREEIAGVDNRILISLHEALTVYLSVKTDIKLSLVDDWIVDELKQRKNIFLEI